jgi:hypothetical protein
MTVLQRTELVIDPLKRVFEPFAFFASPIPNSLPIAMPTALISVKGTPITSASPSKNFLSPSPLVMPRRRDEKIAKRSGKFQNPVPTATHLPKRFEDNPDYGLDDRPADMHTANKSSKYAPDSTDHRRGRPEICHQFGELHRKIEEILTRLGRENIPEGILDRLDDQHQVFEGVLYPLDENGTSAQLLPLAQNLVPSGRHLVDNPVDEIPKAQ